MNQPSPVAQAYVHAPGAALCADALVERVVDRRRSVLLVERKHTTTVVLVAKADGEPVAVDDAGDERFRPLDELPELAFDHEQILADYASGRCVPAFARDG